MQRRGYLPSAALAATLLSAVLAGCTDSPGGSSASDSRAGDPTATEQSAEPGKYRTLPEPCGAVSHGTLQALLPGLDSLDKQQQEEAYKGQAAITYDTDRRVGCRWTAESPQGTRHLTIDFERVVSYDPAVSDDDRAQQLYARKAAAADIPSASPSSTTSASALGKGKGDKEHGDASPSESADSTDTDANTSPRTLDDPGDTAFLDDRLVTGDSGVHRDITLVFRSSNVIVTVEYDAWSTTADQSALPLSQDLQNKAQRLAHELAGHLSE